MTKFQAFKARVLVVLKAAPTWLTAGGVVVAAVVGEVSKILPSGWQDNALAIGGRFAVVIAAAVSIVRRVTPVIEGDKGLLPPDRPVNPDLRG